MSRRSIRTSRRPSNPQPLAASPTFIHGDIARDVVLRQNLDRYTVRVTGIAPNAAPMTMRAAFIAMNVAPSTMNTAFRTINAAFRRIDGTFQPIDAAFQPRGAALPPVEPAFSA